MRDFNKVSPTLWQSSRFADLPSDDGRFLYLYLLTCPHQNSAGCFWLPDGYVCSDVQWERKKYHTARQQLIDADLIQFDDSEQVIFIKRWFRHNPPMNQSHLKGIISLLEKCGSLAVREQCEVELNAVWEEKCHGKTTEKLAAPKMPPIRPGPRPDGSLRS